MKSNKKRIKLTIKNILNQASQIEYASIKQQQPGTAHQTKIVNILIIIKRSRHTATQNRKNPGLRISCSPIKIHYAFFHTAPK